jgi:YrbI family 3-deoxy-D-manno-octulosonate 8-phosphate phosphatase
MKKDIKKKLQNIKLIALDFDGVLTDGMVYVSEDGSEQVRCSRRDGLAVHMLRTYGIEVQVISKEENAVVTQRCKKMGIACNQGVVDGEGKAEILERIAKQMNVSMEQVVFVGDDINDAAALKKAGVAITVSDGHPAIKAIADIITKGKGGEHVLREVAELILDSKGIKTDSF